MVLWSIVILLLLRWTHAQFIQRYNDAPDTNGNIIPHWRRQISTTINNRPVLQAAYPVYLEYNCAKLPSICLNARAWMNNPALSNWNGRAGADVFTYDMYAGEVERYSFGVRYSSFKANRDHRRDIMCDANWRGNRGSCPEVNQPAVLPGPWPFTALETIDPKASDEIEAIRIGNNPPQRSNRQYTCDEFPPASWIEGGGGMPGFAVPEGAGQSGTTFCAPFGTACAGTKVSSEQDWQGSAHAAFNKRLRRLVNDQWSRGHPSKTKKKKKQPWAKGDTVQFHLRLVNIAGGNAVYIRWQDDATGANDFSTVSRRSVVRDFPANLTFYERAALGSSMTERDLIDYGYKTDVLIVHDNGTEPTWRLAEGIDIPASELQKMPSLDLLLGNSSTTMTSQSPSSNSTSIQSSEAISSEATFTSNYTPPNATRTLDAIPWNISAEDVDESLTTYKLETHQDLKSDRIDIIGLSEMYILGQLTGSNATGNDTNRNTSTIQVRHAPRHVHHGHPHYNQKLSRDTTPYNRRAVDGPIQCGVGQDCKDGACCNKDGKCGFKAAHCAPEVCLSNCDAKAMCGIDSADGSTQCGLKLCCSFYGWCGTEKVHCDDPEPQFGRTPCQQGFGSCAITNPPSCGKGSGTARGRRIGYYQGWNTRERMCDKVSPKQINTEGLTHLYFAFVFFHPTTFEMMPMNEADIPIYKEFTDLKSNDLETWVAVGGWSFNDDGAATRTAYSDMVSTSGNRAAFIQSLIKFMETYGFQGADIDWEYPSEPKRGGRTQDADNLVLLLKEMRAAFGTRYGISIALAPDYWYLRGFKPADMQQYVDFMGFMSYDLHGPWDTDVKTLGSLIRPQTDISEIDKNLTPLWFDGVDPSKINMGIAYYGRSYKLADPNCGSMGCSFVPNQGGAPGSCTNSPGVMSNREIRKLIEDENITPILNETAMVKYFTYAGDSWIGYDDADTFAMKQGFANDRCLGGIMIWSIDFDAETGGRGVDDSPSTSDDENLVWVDPEVWKDPNPSIQCFFPCTLVLPPFPASTTTTIDYPRVTVTSVNTEMHTTSTKGTITFPPITVTDYGLLTVTIPGGSTSCQTTSGSSSCTTMPPAVTKVTADVSLSTTSTWPPVTWVDTEGGRSHTTRPTLAPKPTWPPIHIDIKLPRLTINFGRPTPTVKKCAFLALDCPPGTIGPNPTKTRVVTGPAPEETDEDDPDPDSTEAGDPPEDEGEGEEESFCLAIPNNSGGEGGGGGGPDGGGSNGGTTTASTEQAPTTTSTTAAATTTSPPKNTPNFANDSKPKCYNSGYGADRKSMISAISSFCDQMAAAVKKANILAVGKGFYQPDETNLEEGKTYILYDTSFEVMEGCEWSFSATDCGSELRKIVDGCNTKGENGKQGGTMDGACVKWRIDPNIVET